MPRRFIRGSNNFYPRSPCGERRRPDKLQLPQNHFYPRSPCGERPALSLPFGAVWIISIHALLAESDRPNHGKRNKKVKFLSTLSLRRATGRITENGTKKLNFYPRSPCGERQKHTRKAIFNFYFYPRSPCGERQRESADDMYQ